MTKCCEMCRQEDVHLGVYEPLSVQVTTKEGQQLQCRSYTVKQKDAISLRPSPQYLGVILRGAKESGLPEEYINKLKQIEDNGYNGEISVNVQWEELDSATG